MQIEWNSVRLQHCPNPVYLGVTLDRSLTYRKHIDKTKAKVNTRNGILRKLTNVRWGANPNVLRSSALALCYSVAEYASPVWERSAHVRRLDPVLNDTCRLITGCLKPTNLDQLYMLAGIAPPQIRRETIAMAERSKQCDDPRHPLHQHIPVAARLKSRRNFIQSTQSLTASKTITKEVKWEQCLADNDIPTWNIKEKLPAGSDLDWSTWKTLNRLRCQMGRCKNNLLRWGYAEEEACECGEVQTMEHLLTCQSLQDPCTLRDLWTCTENAVICARHWSDI